MLRKHQGLTYLLGHTRTYTCRRLAATLSPHQVTEILSENQISLIRSALPSYIKSIECNQLASNSPIEDRLRISSLVLPGSKEPTLILGVFDGHGGGTTADIITRRLFNYIALSLYPEHDRPRLYDDKALENLIVDLHYSPLPGQTSTLRGADLKLLSKYRDQMPTDANIAAKLKRSFNRCDDDLSREVQETLSNKHSSNNTLHHYLSAAVSGCCALVMVIHQGIGYLASAGDCRAVLGLQNAIDSQGDTIQPEPSSQSRTSAIDLNDEHNCDNINEIRRLASSHPKTEQNTMIRHNRLLGHLMPFRAFGDFNYKWSADTLRACGITRAFGSGIIPPHYNTPPYLIAEPDIREIRIDEFCMGANEDSKQRFLVIASDGLWELFESSREVVECVINHSALHGIVDDCDENCATYILRSALRSGFQDCGLDADELRKLYHMRLESSLTLPEAVSRNFRDDISIIVIKL